MVTATTVPEPTATPTAAAEPTVNPTPTGTPVPSTAATPTMEPPSAPIYTVSCTFAPWILDSTGTVITDINGKITSVYTGDAISGDASGDAYRFTHVSSGTYDLVMDIQYTVYYTNNTTDDRSTRITDSIGVNGNVDKTYPLY